MLELSSKNKGNYVMINSVSYLHNGQRFGIAPAAKEDSSFEDFLVNASTKTPKERTIADEAIDEMKKQLGLYDYYGEPEFYDVPDKWAESPNTGENRKFGWLEAEKYLKSIGIDTDQIQGTHTLTPKQREWIESRTNLDMVGIHNAEYENLIGDLVVLGVLTPEEAKKLFVVTLPPGNGWLSPVSKSEMQSLANGLGVFGGSSVLAAMRHSISLQNSIMDKFLSQKGGLLLGSADKEFVRKASELLTLKQSFYDMMMDLFD